MDHENRGRGEELHDVVAVANGVEAVRVDVLEVELLLHELAVDWEGRAGERAGAKRHDVRALVDALKAGEVAREHPEVREQVMREQDWLCALQMRVARHDDVAVLLRRLDERALQVLNLLLHSHDLAAHVHVRVERDLVVAAARRVQAAAGLADGVGQALLDVHVDVLEIDGELELPSLDLLEDVLEAGDDLVAVLLCDDAAFREHRGMRDGASDVLVVHALVEIDGGLELVDHLIGRLGETASPHSLAHLLFFSCIRARTLSGRPKRLMKPVASAWL